MIVSILRSRLFLFTSLLVFLGSCATTNMLSPMGDATTHGLVVFDGIVKRGHDTWSLFDAASGSSVPHDSGGGIYRVDDDLSNAEFGVLLPKKRELKNRNFNVVQMPAGTYILTSHAIETFGGMMTFDWGSVPQTTYETVFFDQGAPVITVRPGDILFLGERGIRRGRSVYGNRAYFDLSTRRLEEFRKIVGDIVPPSRVQPANYTQTTFDLQSGGQECVSSSQAQMTDWLSDATYVSFMPGHGTQIEYHRADGTNYLWYPGNTRIVKGNWKVTESQKGVDLCYKYSPNTYNPMTGQTGGNWNCRQADVTLFFSVDWRKGDAFGLSRSARVPFVLTRDEVKPYRSQKNAVYAEKCSPVRVDADSPIDRVLANFENRSR